MEKVGSLTFLTRASCGTLQRIGCWFLQLPVAENVQEWNAFLPRRLFFARGIKRICLASRSKIYVFIF